MRAVQCRYRPGQGGQVSVEAVGPSDIVVGVEVAVAGRPRAQPVLVAAAAARRRGQAPHDTPRQPRQYDQRAEPDEADADDGRRRRAGGGGRGGGAGGVGGGDRDGADQHEADTDADRDERPAV